MKKTLSLLFAAALFALSAVVSTAQEKDYDDLAQHRTMKVGSLTREYWVYVPEGLPQGAPLVVCMKGYRDDPLKHPGFSGFMELADREKFVVCVPKACGNAEIGYGMNVGYPFQLSCKDMDKVDDTKFITRIVHKLQREYGLSKENVFCTGSSNGGEMCYQLAYQNPDLFKAFAPQYGLTMTWLYKSTPLPKAVPLIELHGTDDHTSKWEGNPYNKGKWGEYLSVPLALSQFTTKARCTHEIVRKLDPVNPESEREVYLHKWVGGDNGIEIWLYEIVGAGHGHFENEINMEECIWEFFQKWM